MILGSCRIGLRENGLKDRTHLHVHKDVDFKEPCTLNAKPLDARILSRNLQYEA